MLNSERTLHDGTLVSIASLCVNCFPGLDLISSTFTSSHMKRAFSSQLCRHKEASCLAEGCSPVEPGFHPCLFLSSAVSQGCSIFDVDGLFLQMMQPRLLPCFLEAIQPGKGRVWARLPVAEVSASHEVDGPHSEP